MENWLESNRFSSQFNAGESGHRPQTLRDLLRGLQPAFDYNLNEALSDVLLSDAPNMGIVELREQIAALHPGATPEHVLVTTGTSEAFFLLMRQLHPNKCALITPAFQLLTEIPRSLGSEIVSLPVEWDRLGRPSAPIEAWVRLIEKERPEVLILNHPHNPTGLTLSSPELIQLIAAADSVHCTLIGDEHYRFLHRSDALGPTVYAEGRFITGSFIKCSGTPGLRIGWCVGDPNTLRDMQSEKNYLTHTVNPIVQKLSFWFLDALNRNHDYFAGMRRDWLGNRTYLDNWLLQQDLWTGQAPEGGLVCCLFPNPDHTEVLRKKLTDNGVFLLPLSTFKEFYVGWSGFLDGWRLGLGLSPKQFKKMLSVMVS